MSKIKYASYCDRCLPSGKPKPHIIYQFSKVKGVRLRCCLCNHIKSRYTRRFEQLVEWNDSQSQDATKSKGEKNGRKK